MLLETFGGLYYAAADFCSRVARGLAGEIVPPAMNDYRAAYDILNAKTLVIKGQPGIALIGQKGRHIPRMAGMGTAGGIVVVSGAGKACGAVPIFVDMHCVEITGSRNADIRETENLCLDENAAVGGVIEFYQTAEAGSGVIAGYPGEGGGFIVFQQI